MAGKGKEFVGWIEGQPKDFIEESSSCPEIQLISNIGSACIHVKRRNNERRYGGHGVNILLREKSKDLPDLKDHFIRTFEVSYSFVNFAY